MKQLTLRDRLLVMTCGLLARLQQDNRGCAVAGHSLPAQQAQGCTCTQTQYHTQEPHLQATCWV